MCGRLQPRGESAYDEVREQAITKIDEALHTNSEASRVGVYVNVLQQIESLRLICNLGLHYHSRHNGAAQRSAASDDWATTAQQTFNVQCETGPIVCLQCSSATDLAESLLDDGQHDTSASRPPLPQFFRCMRFACGDCVQKLNGATQTLGCGHKPRALRHLFPSAVTSWKRFPPRCRQPRRRHILLCPQRSWLLWQPSTPYRPMSNGTVTP